MQVPWFGGEQPHETYYFSPRVIYLLGRVQEFSHYNKHKNATLHRCAYEKETGGKGGNNVASLILFVLHGLKLVPAVVNENCNQTGDELSIIMDNCSGQNENHMVLRLALMMVDLTYFKKVHFVFLVVGHTKNIADHLFNLEKMRYQKEQIYTFEQLLNCINNCEQDVVHPIDDNEFKDYDAVLDKFYQ